MNTERVSQYIESFHYQDFKAGLDKISSHVENSDEFHMALYYASLVSMMEKYLFDVFITEIEGDLSAFLRMCSMDKYANQTFKLPQILHGNIRNHVINSVKSMVWHRLNDVDPLYKKVFGFGLNISRSLTGIIEVRHDIVHRNGFQPETHEDWAGFASLLFKLTPDVKLDNLGEFLPEGIDPHKASGWIAAAIEEDHHYRARKKLAAKDDDFH